MKYLKELMMTVVVSVMVLQNDKMVDAKIMPGVPAIKIPKGPKLPTIKKPSLPKWNDINRFFQNGEKAQALWDTIENSADFFEKIREMLKKKENPEKLVEGWKSYEFLQCHPDSPNSICHSECKRSQTTYRWCYISSELSKWSTCQCEVRSEIKQWLVLAKEKLMKKGTILMTTEYQQWITIGVIGLAFLFLVICLIGRYIWNKRTANRAPIQDIQLMPNAQQVRNNDYEEVGHNNNDGENGL